MTTELESLWSDKPGSVVSGIDKNNDIESMGVKQPNAH